MSTLAKGQGIVLNAVDVLLAPIRGGVPSKSYFRLNAQSVTLTPASVTTGEIISTQKHSKGNTLETYAGEVEPMELEINFDWGSPRAYAIAFGAQVEEFSQDAGTVTDEEVTNLNAHELTVLEHGAILVDTFTLSKDGQELEPGTDYEIDPESGKLTALNDALESGDITASYEHAKIVGNRYDVGTATLSAARLILDGQNAVSGGRQMKVTAWHVNFTPSDSVAMMGAEPIAPTITGSAQMVVGKKSPVEVIEYEAEV